MPDRTLLTEDDLYLFNEGTHYRLFDKLGAHIGEGGVSFAVWAPNARRVSVFGDFNGWSRSSNPLRARGQSGIWEGFIAGMRKGDIYKYFIESHHHGHAVEKADPFGLHYETPPKTGSIVWNLDFEWTDEEWMATRSGRNALDAPISIYEVHVGSWMRIPEDGGRSLSYRELAPRLADYVERLGFTHVEFLPVMEHPFYGSWGYQTTGYFAPTSRYGTPQDFMALVDHLHCRGIGVILDWVPSHFPIDQHGPAFFDGTHLYEHGDPRQGFHPDWQSAIFNYGRHEIRSFLVSSARLWLDVYHADGLRVDAVASMLYLDYSREDGEWIPNPHGGNENLEALMFMRDLNEEVYRSHPDVQTYAEESTAWPMVSRPTYLGGLGFGLKWDMGWMHDTLQYMNRDPIFRRYHHGEITFRGFYGFTENFLLPLSHDEVVHGKGSLLGRMPGDEWQRFANLRLLYAYMYATPAKKLLFMGCEFGQRSEWNHEQSLDWHLTENEQHAGVQRLLTDLNRLYRDEPALHDWDLDPAGFEWIDASDAAASILTFLRKGRSGRHPILVACNFTPVPRHDYRVGVPLKGRWEEILNSDGAGYGGSGVGNLGGTDSSEEGWHGRPHSLDLTVPPLAVVYLRHAG